VDARDWLQRDHFGSPLLHRDDGAVGDSQDLGAEGEPLLAPQPVAFEELAAAQPHPVDGEGLRLADALTGDRDANLAVDRGRRAAGVASQLPPRNGGAMIVTGRGSTGSSGPANSKLPNSERPSASGATS
jgi:hypothetical protein